MQGLKKFGLVVSVGLFGPLFLLSIFSFAFNRTLGSQDYTKQTIKEAGFYAAVGETIKTQAGAGQGTDPLVVSALQSAVSGDNLQNTLEPLIDGTYDWLSGVTQQPKFSLAIEPLKANFQKSLTAALQSRATSLPACSRAVRLTGEDIFTYNCIPPGTDVTAVINDAVTKISNNASVFSDEVVADGTVSAEEAQNLGINDPTQNLPNTLPRLYQFLSKGLWFFVVGTILTAVGVVLLSLTKLHGLRKLGVLLVINGVGVLVAGLLMGYLVSTLIPTAAVEATDAAVNAIKQASKIILADNAAVLKIVGLASTALGGVGIITSTILINRNKAPAPVTAPTAPQKETQRK